MPQLTKGQAVAIVKEWIDGKRDYDYLTWLACRLLEA